MSPHSKRKLIHYWRRHIRPIGVLILVFTCFRSIAADWNDVPTGSMRPTIIDGDRIYVNKLAYGLKFPFTTWHLARWNTPARGEIVIFYSPVDDIRLVKRVIGVPGDHIKIDGDMLTVNGRRLQYEELPPETGDALPEKDRRHFRYFRETLGDYPHTIAIAKYPQDYINNPFRDMAEFVVPEGKYFMMGDNRDNSRDGRFFNQTDPRVPGWKYDPDAGCVPVSSIVGRSSRTVWSLDRDNSWMPRKDRWLKGLP